MINNTHLNHIIHLDQHTINGEYIYFMKVQLNIIEEFIKETETIRPLVQFGPCHRCLIRLDQPPSPPYQEQASTR